MKILSLVLLTLLFACGKSAKKSSQSRQDVTAIYQSSEILVKVYYEEGAAPYTDGALNVGLWNLLQVNLESLFEGKQVQVKVPKTLSEMAKLPVQNKASWSIDETLNLASPYTVQDTSGVSTFHIFFVNGHSADGPGVIGFHISNTKVMIIFKDVIRSSGVSLVTKYVEQATLIHEMGHALGLVNNGLPMVSAHQDTAHGAHCSNPKCVMYYSNEGTSSMLSFAAEVLSKGSVEMFDQNCLKDAQSFQK